MAIKSRSKYTSKGERYNISPNVCRAIRKDRTVVDYWMRKQAAWLKGHNPWITIDNPNPNATNARKIRVRAENEWGDPKWYMKIKQKQTEQT